MAFSVDILPSAEREYRSIVDYLFRVLCSPQAARGFMDEFDRQVGMMADNPGQFPVSRMPELAAKGYRTALVNSYIALFKVEGSRVAVAHVFHQSQDYAQLV